ncbi:hypothetical protein [Dongia mobilis]|jgi:hypothetical protein|uniref:hypothetical protein n=1 Tax=Dongia sp. TaxID=1977262 RepID=UPI0026EC8EA2
MGDPRDIAALAQAGVSLRTRDRRDVTVTSVDAETGRISGIVPMVGPCHWRRDGQFEGAGSAGPLDLVPKQATTEPQLHASVAEALGDPAAKNACCD